MNAAETAKGIEIIFSLCWLCGEFKKKACSKWSQRLTAEEKNNEKQGGIVSLNEKKQNSVILVDEGLQHFQCKAEMKSMLNEVSNIKEELNQLKRKKGNSLGIKYLGLAPLSKISLVSF